MHNGTGTELDADFRAAGEFLHRASRITTNAFVTQLLQGDDDATLDRGLVERLSLSVAKILEGLPPRQRSIVERCDFGGETREVVAAELGISVRHFRRERAAAHKQVAKSLKDLRYAPTGPGASVRPCDDGMGATFRMSQVLENNGQWAEAAALLERLAESVGTEQQRYRAELHLSRLYVDVERFALARRHAERACALAVRFEPSQRWHEFETDVVWARIQDATGKLSEAAEILHRASLQLRSWAPNTNDTLLDEAIAEALMHRAAIDAGRGKYAQALQAVTDSEAMSERIARPEPDLAITLRLLGALTRLACSGPFSGGAEALYGCYEDAIAQGLTRKAVLAAASMCKFYRAEGRPEKVIEVLTPLSETAKAVGTGLPYSYFLFELVQACVEARRFEHAAPYLEQLLLTTQSNPPGQAWAQLAVSRVRAGLGHFERALGAAEAAEGLFMRTSIERGAALALLSQAQAAAALGRRQQAQRVLTTAFDMLDGATPPNRLAAYELMAKVSGDSKYAVEARKLRKRLNA